MRELQSAVHFKLLSALIIGMTAVTRRCLQSMPTGLIVHKLPLLFSFDRQTYAWAFIRTPTPSDLLPCPPRHLSSRSGTSCPRTGFAKSHLNSHDIFDIQTCRDFRNLLQDFAGTIWKECLLRQCLVNGVFWPSYDNLTEPAQFKLAATSALRFIKTYERGVASPPIFGQSTSVAIQADNEDILDFYLVQGGRFLVTLEPRRIAMWDMTQTPDRRSDILVWTYENKYEVDVLQATRIIDATSILLLFTLKSPRNCPRHDPYVRGFTPSAEGLTDLARDSSNPSGQYSVEYLILEVCPEDGGQGFEVRREQFLCLTAPDFKPTAISFTWFTGTVLLHVVNLLAESIFIVWDYVCDSLTSIRFDSDRTIHGVGPGTPR